MSDPYSTHPYPAEPTVEVRRRWSADTILKTCLWKGLTAVATQCDAARTADSVGFSSYDAGFASDILAKGGKYGWSEKQFIAARKLAYKYRKQVERLAGITQEALDAELDSLAPPAKDTRGKPGDELVWVTGEGRTKYTLNPNPKSEIAVAKGGTHRKGPVVFVPLSLIKAKRGLTPSARVHYQVPRWYAEKNARLLDIVPAPDLPEQPVNAPEKQVA